MTSDANMWRSDIEDVCDHILEDDGRLFGGNLSENDSEGGEGTVPSGITNSKSSQWQVGRVISADACG